MRYLSIDLGDKRTGLATGDDELRIVSPAGVIEVPRVQEDRLLDELANAVRAHDANAIVMGLPLNMDGSAGPRATLVRAFARRLAQRTGLAVHEQDERLTSVEADWQMAGTGLTHKQKKARRDALAAAAILNDFLLNLDSGTGSQTPADPADEPGWA